MRDERSIAHEKARRAMIRLYREGEFGWKPMLDDFLRCEYRGGLSLPTTSEAKVAVDEFARVVRELVEEEAEGWSPDDDPDEFIAAIWEAQFHFNFGDYRALAIEVFRHNDPRWGIRLVGGGD